MALALGQLCLRCHGQPAVFSGPIKQVDFDNNGAVEISYDGGARKIRNPPETWLVNYGIEPWTSSRILRATGARINFLRGELINGNRRAVTNYISNDPDPPSEAYGIRVLSFSAVKHEDWIYSTEQAAFEGQSDVFIGLKLSLATGVHYGWLHLSRATADSHTQFDVAGYSFHPVPEEPIPAGQEPSLPSIQIQVGPESLTFSWDSSWGALVLESATNLPPSTPWELYIESNGSEVKVPISDDKRFFRLRQP